MAIRQIGAIGSASMPPRTALARAAPQESSLPYLRPYDVFDYLPTAADHVSVPRNANVDTFQITAGDILQTRSGRNLGPCTIADNELAKFALSDDMIRIKVDDKNERLLLLAYLKTSLGQALIRRGRSGSVIDHLTVPDVEAVPVPVFPKEVVHTVSGLVGKAIECRERGRSLLNELLRRLMDQYPHSESQRWTWWSMQARDLGERLDSGHHHPVVAHGRRQLHASNGVALGAMAKAILPIRYKRYYVEEGHGRPIVSGRQLLQPEPINLRYVSDRSFRNPEDYEIHAGCTVFGAVGRAEGRQAWPALVTSDRDGWLASNDVMRLVPRRGVRPGAVWLAVATPQVQAQIKALSFGSVVDHMNPWDVEQVIVPDIEDPLAKKAESAWEDFARSTELIGQAVARLEQSLEEFTR
ncbi:hypothetical protein SAMN04489727_1911 [Amycolatopsis tolypomycina]|uniref:Type I restriction enzyme, S subunit n=2 Tax=Amycolatopsis tolypomycina TaxID=208445 RepID=A0A1H4JHP4_9PSEU|nr:hypothetical protein SAMN04489727_1911 [Amycolatopsis tolypomycina]